MRWTIGKKLALGFGTIIALMIISTAVAYYNAARIDRNIDEVASRAIPVSLTTQHIVSEVNHDAAALRGYMLMVGHDPVKCKYFKDARKHSIEEIAQSVSRLNELSSNW